MANASANKAPEFRAEARFQRVSPQKAKLVLDLIKGKPVETALNIVAFTNKRIAPVIEKTLRSAVQNAQYLSDERGLDVDVDSLYVKSAVANDGPRMKRIRPAPMGRAFRYQRRIAHIVITIGERKAQEAVAATPASTPAPAAESTGRKTAAKKKAPRKAPAKKAAAKKAAAKKSAPKKKAAAK
jgi:large subunit ribosomal protein L22